MRRYTRYCEKVNKTNLFFISSTLLFAVHFASHLQAEMLGVVFLLLATSLYLRETLFSRVFSGIVIGSMFFLKTPMVILGASLFFAVLIIKKETFKREVISVIPTAFSALMIISVLLLFFKIYNEQELIDIWNASFYQHTLLHELTFKSLIVAVMSFFFHFIDCFLYNPITLFGFVILIRNIYVNVLAKEIGRIAFEISVWLFPAIYIMLSNCYFIYHYYLFAYSAIITIMLSWDYIYSLKNKKIKIVLTSSLALYFIFFSSAISPYSIKASKEYQTRLINTEKEIKHLIGKSTNETMLYLDDGTGAFLFPNKSHLRYTYPLPIQRIEDNTPFTKSNTYVSTKQEILSYSGKFLTLSQWFFGYSHDDIKNKIKSEYVICQELNEFSFSWELLGEKLVIRDYLLYRRK